MLREKNTIVLPKLAPHISLPKTPSNKSFTARNYFSNYQNTLSKKLYKKIIVNHQTKITHDKCY